MTPRVILTNETIYDFVHTMVASRRDAAALARLAAADVSLVTDMHQLFFGLSMDGVDLSAWDVSNVTNMDMMFAFASFADEVGLRHWNTSRVQTMSGMFWHATTFNEPIGAWDTARVENMAYLFHEAWAFNQPIGNWDVTNCTNMEYMFQDARAFNQALNAWNTAAVQDMACMFDNARAFNQALTAWNTAAVRDMSHMFSHAHAFRQPIGPWAVPCIDRFDDFVDPAYANHIRWTQVPATHHDAYERMRCRADRVLLHVLARIQFCARRRNVQRQHALTQLLDDCPVFVLEMCLQHVTAEILQRLR